MTVTEAKPKGLDRATLERMAREFDGRYGQPRAVDARVYVDPATGAQRDAIRVSGDPHSTIQQVVVIRDTEMTDDLSPYA